MTHSRPCTDPDSVVTGSRLSWIVVKTPLPYCGIGPTFATLHYLTLIWLGPYSEALHVALRRSCAEGYGFQTAAAGTQSDPTCTALTVDVWQLKMLARSYSTSTDILPTAQVYTGETLLRSVCTVLAARLVTEAKGSCRTLSLIRYWSCCRVNFK